MPNKLLQIVPRLPPSISGVGDYALLLAHELASTHDVQSQFLNCDPTWKEESISFPFPAVAVHERSASALTEVLEQTDSCQAVLLHYVGYGFALRGCPFWLVSALEKWKQRTGGRLIVLFHELYATGPVWASSFWTSGLQASLAKRLARLGDNLRITTEFTAKQLRTMLPSGSKKPVRVQPVFSTLGEPVVLPTFQERDRQMIVFGGGGWRRAAYTHHLPILQNACRHLQIERVIDIGTPISIRPTLSVPFVEYGVLPAQETSELMLKSTAGFFTYSVLHIGKSTIFAAYCAHGMVPVTFPENHMPGDQGLQSEQHFLATGSQRSHDENSLAKLATAAHSWYQQHRLAVHAHEIHENLLRD